MSEDKLKEKVAAIEAAVSSLIDTVDNLLKLAPIMSSSVYLDDVMQKMETSKNLMRDCINLK